MSDLLHCLLIDSSYPINTRNVKIVDTLNSFSNMFCSFITWNRDGRPINSKDKDSPIYNKKAGYGKLMKKLVSLIGYYRFLKCYNQKKMPEILIASHWDMLLLAILMKKNGQLLIYENLDIPTHENLWVLGILRNIEKWALKKADAIVFASRFFADLYPDFDKPQFVLENKPLSVSSICELKYGGLKKPFTVSFIGAVRYGDILVNLMEAIRGDNEIQLYIHGEGADLNRLMTFSMGSSNIHFTGRYEVDQLPKLYMTSDIVWAAYPNKDFNVKYAISNKYHESIQYCVPCIYAEHTRLGDFVKEHNLGYVVNPYSVEDIRECIDYIKNTPEQLYRTRECLKRYIDKEKTWKEQFLPFYQYLISMMKKES